MDLSGVSVQVSVFSTASGRRSDQFDRKRNFCLEVSYGEFHTRFQFLLFSLLTPDTRNLKPNSSKQKVETKTGKSNEKLKLSNEECQKMKQKFRSLILAFPFIVDTSPFFKGNQGYILSDIIDLWVSAVRHLQPLSRPFGQKSHKGAVLVI